MKVVEPLLELRQPGPTAADRPEMGSSRLLPSYLEWFYKRKSVWHDLHILWKGMGVQREAVSSETFLRWMPWPHLATQAAIQQSLSLGSKISILQAEPPQSGLCF